MSVDYRIGDTRAVTRTDSHDHPSRTERELLQLLTGAHHRLDEQHVPPADHIPAYRALEPH